MSWYCRRTLLLIASVCAVLNAVCGASKDRHQAVSHYRRLPIAVGLDGLGVQQGVRAVAQSNSTKVCNICGGLGGTGILPNTYPPYDPNDVDGDTPLTCEDFQSLAATQTFDEEGHSATCTILMSAFSDQCCDLSERTSPHKCESVVQSNIIGDGSDYNPNIPPLPAGEGNLEIKVALTYYHLTELSIVHGMAEMLFGIDMTWKDERLRWDPADVGGCTLTTLRASVNAEVTDIWVPDWDLLNRVSGVQALPEAMATVWADGHVRWFRMGGIRALCALSGLERIPFDELNCYLDFGTTLYRPGVTYVFGDDNRMFSGNENGIEVSDEFPAKYQEYRIIKERTTAEILDTYGPMRFSFYFRRAVSYYVSKIVIPTILFTFLSFGTFLLDLRVGERLAFGVSLLLVIVAQDIVTSDMLPLCNELLWINVLLQMSQYWIVVAVMESLIVAYIYFLDAKERNEENNARNAAAAAAEPQPEIATSHTEPSTVPSEINETDESADEYVAAMLESIRKGNTVVEESDKSVVEESVSKGKSVVEESVSKGKSVVEDSDSDEVSAVDNQKDVESPPPKKHKRPFRTLRQVLMRHPTTTETKKQKIIRSMDNTCLIVLPITYVIFVIAMFARNKYW